MTPAQIILYSRKDCCLCEEMKKVIQAVRAELPLTIEEVDVDESSELQERYGGEVPVLLIDGRKAFKYRATIRELKKKIRQSTRLRDHE